MARLFKLHAPRLIPILQVRIVESQGRVETVGEDFVVARDVLDDEATGAFEETLGDELPAVFRFPRDDG